MSQNFDLVSIFLTNMLGIMMMVVLIFNNAWRFKHRDLENRIILGMIICVLISCAADPVCFACDGQAGMWHRIGVYAGNTWLYLSTAIIGPMFIGLVSKHINGFIGKRQAIFMELVAAVGIIALVFNFFVPLVFSVDENNVYARGPLYWMFTVIEAVLILDGILVYVNARRKGGILKFFPVWQFIIPVVIGIIVQSALYGVSAIWPSMAVSICGMMSALQNEIVFQDRLTGLYNRFYLDNLKKDIIKRHGGRFTAMMLDMNDFKSINDRFGHAEGDVALQTAAELLKGVVGNIGTVIRFAGDEFVILLNTQEEEIVDGCMEAIRRHLEEYNRTSGKKYKLAMAIGSCPMDFKAKTIEELLNEVDALMYEDKKRFYSHHKEMDRRRHDDFTLIRKRQSS